MFIFDVIGDMLSALGLVAMGGIGIIGWIVIIISIVIMTIISLLTLWLIACVAWFWIRKGFCKVTGRTFIDDGEMPGARWLEEKISK